jgi:hypothetical protein
MVEDNHPIKISSHWVRWMSMSNKQMTPDLYINLLADGFTHMDIFFPNDREDKMFSEKDPKKLGRNLVQIAMEKMEIEKAVENMTLSNS